MKFYIVIFFFCFYLLYILVEEMFENLLSEFAIDKTQPLSIDLLKKIIRMVVEKKICSKFYKPLPPVTQNLDITFIKAICIIFSCTLCAFIGYISGIWKRKNCTCYIEQNIQFRNNSYNTINNSDNNEPSICSLCLYVFKPRMMLLPCKHICICTNCWIQFYRESQHNCPICREYIEEVMQVYST